MEEDPFAARGAISPPPAASKNLFLRLGSIPKVFKGFQEPQRETEISKNIPSPLAQSGFCLQTKADLRI